ncbi:hypothetical protein PUN4_340198 [Paraburkholderia unamae]|nr:hypothetical protein PUN4_340198 [Paraburkholderia unamae]
MKNTPPVHRSMGRRALTDVIDVLTLPPALYRNALAMIGAALRADHL